MTRAEAYAELENGREPESLSTPALEAIIADLTRIRNARLPRLPWFYSTLYGDAGLLREALVADLAEWITAGFVEPGRANRWQAARRRLELLTSTRRNLIVDQLYADAALVLGAVDDAELLRVSELS